MHTLYFSRSTHGFYDSAIHADNIPQDVCEITREEHAALLAGQGAGKRIVADVSGRPYLEDPPQPSREQLVAAKWEAIKAERGRRTDASGFQVGGKWYHSDLASKTQHLANKDTARDQLAAGGAMADALLDPGSGAPILWKTMDGSFQALTCQLAFEIVKAGKACEFEHFRVAEVHRQTMEASSDPAAYDCSTGWPPAFNES